MKINIHNECQLFALCQELSRAYNNLNNLDPILTSICNKESKSVNCRKILKKTQNNFLNLRPILAELVKRQKYIERTEEETKEDLILSFILRKYSKNVSQCKSKLKNYCELIKKINVGLDNVDPKLKEICNSDERDEKCTGIRRHAGRLSVKLKKSLRSKLKRIEENKESLTDDECTKYQIECMLLEGTYPNLVSIMCSTLIIICYEKKQKNLAKEILFRGLKGNLKDVGSCNKKIKEICIELYKERDELMEMCLNQENICQDLVKTAQKNCEDLKRNIKSEKENLNNQTCRLLFKECHFYQPNCKDLDEHNCKEIIKECENKGIIYLPFVRPFSPIEPQITLREEIGLNELYKSTEFEEILTEKPKKKAPIYILPLLIKNSGLDPDDDDDDEKDEICEDELNKKCDFLESLKNNMENICKDDKKKNCEKRNQLSEKCNNLKKNLYNKDLSSIETSEPSKLFSWMRLPKSLTKEDCTHLLSECFYLETHCVKNLNLTCRNAKIACYREGRIMKTNKMLQEILRGMLHNLDDYTNFKRCQQKLIEECKTLKNRSDIFFFLCLESMYTCLELQNVIQTKETNLFEVLGEKRDRPTNQDCFELEKLCKELESDSELIHKPCSTLKRHCIFRDNSMQLKDYLLEKKKNSFSNITQCKKNLKKECNKLFKKENLFNYSCVEQEESCDLMHLEVLKHCAALKNNMETLDILGQITQNSEELCMLWGGYCEKLSPNCNDLLEKTAGKDEGLCTQLKNKCELFFQKKEMKNALTYELEGNLSSEETCTIILNEYCAKKRNINSTIVISPCENGTNNSEEYRKDLCRELATQIKNRCPELLNEITKIAENLEERQKEFEKIKKEAKEIMEEIKIILSTQKTNDKVQNDIISSVSNLLNKVRNKKTNRIINFKLVKRENLKTHDIEKEGIAFNLVTYMFEIYLDLKEICNHLSENCKFKKECSYEESCKKMENICTGLELLEIMPRMTKTITENLTIVEKTTTLTTIIITEETKTTKIFEKSSTKKLCTSIFTTDIQITHTSTHISTSTQISIHTNIFTQTSTLISTVTFTKSCDSTKYITKTLDELKNIKPSEGFKIDAWNAIKGLIIIMIVSFMI
ncbi:hypothetical protein PMAC_000460 [Pneumocystis sp. 'macacae']|nr:hypothetical protein PMAC_000460 [Pneumocystis sp. 'macacae']